MSKSSKAIYNKLLSKGINLEEDEDLIRDILNGHVPESTDEIEYIRVNKVKNYKGNSNEAIKGKSAKRSGIMEEFQKINENNKYATYDYFGIDKNIDFYDYDDILSNLDMIMTKDKFYQEVSIFDDAEKFKEMMNNELIKRYKIKPYNYGEINMNKINDTINCAFAIMGYNRERKKLVDDEKTVWHQQINEATELYDKLISLGVDVDKRIIMNAIVSPKDVLHFNKDSNFIKILRHEVDENNKKKLLASRKKDEKLYKLSKSGHNRLYGHNNKNYNNINNHSNNNNNYNNANNYNNYELYDDDDDNNDNNKKNKKISSRWNSVRRKVDCYNQLVYNARLRNMVRYFVKKRRECKKEIRENYVVDMIPFISSFPRRYRNEPSENEHFEFNFLYSDNYINPYHNYRCLFTDDMALFSNYNNYYY